MLYSCLGCKKVLAKEGRRRTKEITLNVVGGAKLIAVAGKTTKIVCPRCDRVLVLMKGKAGKKL